MGWLLNRTRALILYSTKHHIQIPVLVIDDAKRDIPHTRTLYLQLGIKNPEQTPLAHAMQYIAWYAKHQPP